MQSCRSSRSKRPARSLERALAASGTLALVSAMALTGLAPGTSSASSHREAPLTSGDPKADNTDVYAFTSPDKPDTVTLVANWIPFQEPNGGPNFYPFANDARYNIKIDGNGDGKPDTTYTWAFTDHIRDDANQFLYNTGVVKTLDDPTLNFRQTYTLTATDAHGSTKTLLKDAPAAPSNVGVASMPDYASLRKQAVQDLPNGGQTFAGQASDPFFLDLRIFDLLYGGNLKETGHNTLMRLQRQHHRPPGAQEGSGPQRRRHAQPGRRHLVHHRPQGRGRGRGRMARAGSRPRPGTPRDRTRAPRPTRAGSPTGVRSHASVTRWSTRWSSR